MAGIGKRRLRGGTGALTKCGQLKRCAAFILIERHEPSRRKIAVSIGGCGPGLVSGAGGVVAAGGGMEDLAGDDFVGTEAGAGDVHGAAWRIIRLVGAHGWACRLGEAGGRESRN